MLTTAEKVLSVILAVSFLLLLAIYDAGAVEGNTVYMPLAVRGVSSGMATVSGRVIAEDPEVTVRLVECWYRKVFVLDMASSPGTYSDEDGYFIFEEVEAVDYVIVIGDMIRGFLVIHNENGTARIFTPVKDGVLDVGWLITKPRSTGGGNISPELLVIGE